MAPSLKTGLALLALSSTCLANPVGGSEASLISEHARRTEAAAAGCSLVSSPPKKTICGSKGTIANPVLANNPLRAANLKECQAACLKHSKPHAKYFSPEPEDNGCLSFGYDSDGGICSLYANTVSGMKFTEDPSSSTVFYGRQCYQCPAACPQKIGPNLLDNSAFDDDPSLFGPWGSKDGGITPNGGQNGTQAFFCGYSNDCQLFQTAQFCRGNTYHLSFVYKIDAKQGQSNTLSVIGGNAEYLNFIGDTGPEFQTFSMYFTSDFNGLGGIFIDFYPNSGKSKSNLTIDNVFLSPVLANFKPSRGSKEKLVNPGFETGKFTPWTKHTFGVNKLSIASPGITGDYAAEFQGHVTDRDGTNSLSQSVSNLTPGTMYLLQYRAQKISGQADLPTTFIGNILYEPPFITQQPKNYQFSLPFLAETSSTTLEMDFDFGPLLIDDVSIKAL